MRKPFVRGGRASGQIIDGWDVRPHFADPDPAAQNEAVLAGLAGGATSVWLRVDDPATLDRVLQGVLLDLAPVVLDGGHVTVAAAHRLVYLWNQSGASPSDIGGSFRADPVGLLARNVLAQLVFYGIAFWYFVCGIVPDITEEDAKTGPGWRQGLYGWLLGLKNKCETCVPTY